MTLSGITMPWAMASFFLLCLEVDSPADDWYQMLRQPICNDWVQIEPAFIAKWNAQHMPATLAMEKTQALLDYKLRLEDVGTMVSDMGRTQHAHIP
jgi:hypothetical protein